MKKLLHPVILTIIMTALLLVLPYMLPSRVIKVFDDEQLRQVALSGNMLSIPTSYEKLLEVIDNPQNPMSKEKIALGKELFFDTLLSKDKSINCASCHVLEEGGDDNMAVAVGHQGRKNPFHLNSPTVLNAALAQSQFWNGSAIDVEEQAGGPIQAPFEMNMTPQEVEQRLNADSVYVAKFKAIFPQKKVTFENVRKAIGAYERTLLTRGAYDDFLDGNNSAMSPEAKRGMTLFMTKGCKGCHTGMSVGGQSVQKFPLRNYPSDYLGLLFSPDINLKNSPFPFENKGGFLGRNNILEFRVPILRNITKTAPYFHNGAEEELEEVVRIMSKYQIGEEFSPKQIDEVVAFFKTLEGELVKYEIK